MTRREWPSRIDEVASQEITMQTTLQTDRAATALSLACIVHCLALPLLAAFLPFAAAVAEAEWVHWVLGGLAVIASTSVAATAHSARTSAFLVPAGVGVVLVVSGLFAEYIGLNETVPTVIGGFLIAFAHIRRIIQHI